VTLPLLAPEAPATASAKTLPRPPAARRRPVVAPEGATIVELCAVMRALPEGAALIEACRELRESELVEYVVGHSAAGESRIAMTSRPDLAERYREGLRVAEAAMHEAGMPRSGSIWLSVLCRVLP